MGHWLALVLGALLGIASTLISLWWLKRDGYIRTSIGPGPAKEMIMQNASHSASRFIRFAIWAILMFTAFLVTEAYKPQKAIVVSSLFMAFFVPMVLLPLRTKKN